MIQTGKRYSAIFNAYNSDEHIEFTPVAVFSDPDSGDFSIVAKNGEITVLKNGKRLQFFISDFTSTGVLSNSNTRHIKEIKV